MMNDLLLPFGLFYLALFISWKEVFVKEFIKSNIGLFVAFMSTWWVGDLFEKNQTINDSSTMLAVGMSAFIVANFVCCIALGVRSVIVQVSCALFQLEVSRSLIIGEAPDLEDYIESNAYLYVIGAAGAAVLGKRAKLIRLWAGSEG